MRATADRPDGDLRQAEDALTEAMRRGDVAVLDRLLADDLSFTAPDGSRLNKRTDLEAHRAGTVRFEKITVLHRDVHEGVTEATTTCTAAVTVVDHGRRIDAVLRYDRQWRRSGNRWQVIAGSATAVDF